MKVFIHLLLLTTLLSCSSKNQITNSASVSNSASDTFSLDMDLLKAKLNAESPDSIDSTYNEIQLLPEYIIKMSNEEGDQIFYAVAFNYAGQVYPNDLYRFNQWAVTDEQYNVRLLMINEIGNPNKVFTTDIGIIIGSYLRNNAARKAENHIVIELNGQGNLIGGKIYGQVGNRYDFWKSTEIKTKSYSERDDVFRDSISCTTWDWMIFPNVSPPKWLSLTTTCIGGGSYPSGGGNRYGDFIPDCIVNTAICSDKKRLHGYPHKGILHPFTDSYSPEVWGRFDVETIEYCFPDGSTVKSCNRTTTTYIQGEAGAFTFTNLQSQVIGHRKGWHSWSAFLDCNFGTFAGNSLNCGITYNEDQERDYSIGNECLCID